MGEREGPVARQGLSLGEFDLESHAGSALRNAFRELPGTDEQARSIDGDRLATWHGPIDRNLEFEWPPRQRDLVAASLCDMDCPTAIGDEAILH